MAKTECRQTDRVGSWTPDQERRLRERLRELLAQVIIDEKGPHYRATWHLDAGLYLLAATLRPGLEEQFPGSVLSNAVFRSVLQMKLLKADDLDAFRRLLNQYLGEYAAGEEQTYNVLFPLNVAAESLTGREFFNLRGTELSVQTWDAVKRTLQIDEWLNESQDEQSRDLTRNLDQFVPLTATVHALDEEEAFRRAWPGFHLLNGILNFALGSQTYTVFSTAYWQPVGDVLLPPMHGVFDASGTFKLPFLHRTGAITYRKPALGAAKWAVADRFLKMLSHAPPPNSILDVIAEALGRYDDALQTHDWSEGFFILWQLLEAITHPPKEKTVNIDNVCVRVSRLLGNSSFVLDLLREISDARNRFVHAGQPPDDPLKEFGFLKTVAGACIDSLYSMRESLHTRNDLMVFFRYAGMKKEELANHSRIIHEIQNGKDSSFRGDS